MSLDGRSRPVLWTGAEVVATTGGRALGHLDWQATGVTHRAERVTSGDLFFSLKKKRADRNKEVRTALESGAVAAVVPEEPEETPSDASLIATESPEEALSRLSRVAARRASSRSREAWARPSPKTPPRMHSVARDLRRPPRRTTTTARGSWSASRRRRQRRSTRLRAQHARS